jgi:FecR-like protein
MVAAIIVLMQYMISAKAGLVNYVEGQANVIVHQQVSAGAPIQTWAQSHVEILLNPGSFLRLDENTTVVLDSVDLTNIEVRVVSGAILIETAQADKQTPIRVTAGNLKTAIVAPGVYQFSGDTASVIDGKLRTADGSLTARKGQEITDAGGQYEKEPLNLATSFTDLDQWSQQRSAELARANALAAYEQSGGLGGAGGYFYSGSGWLYSPFLLGYTFIPLHSYRSYWGYNFAPVAVFNQKATIGRPPLKSGIPQPSAHPPSGSSSGSVSHSMRAGSRSSGGHGGHGGHGGGHR